MFDEKSLRMDLLNQSTPMLVIEGNISHETYDKVIGSLILLQSRGSPSVNILIDSPGGDVGAGLVIFDAVRLYPGVTTGVVHRGAASMAAVILQACKSRKCARHAGILIHYVSRERANLDDMRHVAKRAKMIDQLETRQKRIDVILAERTHKSVSVIRKECRKDEWMTSEEALEFGLIDEII